MSRPREITRADKDAAIRGLALWSKDRRELEALSIAHGKLAMVSGAFASTVIAEAVDEVIAARKARAILFGRILQVNFCLYQPHLTREQIDRANCGKLEPATSAAYGGLRAGWGEVEVRVRDGIEAGVWRHHWSVSTVSAVPDVALEEVFEVTNVAHEKAGWKAPLAVSGSVGDVAITGIGSTAPRGWFCKSVGWEELSPALVDEFLRSVPTTLTVTAV